MSYLNVIWYILQLLIGYNLVLPLLLYLLWIIFIKQRSKAGRPSSLSSPDYAIIVTAYEQTDSLPAVVQSILNLNYSRYVIYIVADKCDVSTLHFSDERIVLLRPPETLASNVRSHFYAINHFVRHHERLAIVDSDNLVEPEFLNRLNEYFERGFEAVQGTREAKNLDTVYSCLDAARDIYYHFYDGKILFQLGSSATLAGSGMAFTTDLYKECLGKSDISGAGFDKVLQKEIVARNKRIAFAADAVVYDEKTSRTEQLINQRSRWINTWFRYFKYGFHLTFEGVKNRSLNQALFGVILLRPPLFIFILLSLVCLVINIVFNPILSVIWLIAIAIFILGFIISLRSSHTDRKIYKSLTGIPKFVFLQVISLFKAKNANKRSVATVHYTTNRPMNP